MKTKIVLFATMLIVGITGTAFLTAEKVTCQNGTCMKIKSDGYRCKSCAQAGSVYCWSHNR